MVHFFHPDFLNRIEKMKNVSERRVLWCGMLSTRESKWKNKMKLKGFAVAAMERGLVPLFL